MSVLSRSIRISPVAALASVLFATAAAWGLANYYKAQSLAEITIVKADSGYQITTKLPHFEMISDYSAMTDEGPQLFLLESKTTKSYATFAEGINGSVTWKVRTGDQLKSVLWTMTETATEISYVDDIRSVVTRLGGCCSAMDTLRAYDLVTGKLLISYNDLNSVSPGAAPYARNRPFMIEVPNSKLAPRMIGVITSDSTRDTDFEAPTPGYTAVALIKYNSLDGGYQKLQVETQMAENYGASVSAQLVLQGEALNRGELRDGKVTLWHRDGAKDKNLIDGVALELEVNNGTADLIGVVPVLKDGFSLPAATLPNGLIVRRLR
jgi:hypothetical protein